MNKQELIERIEDLKNVFGNEAKYIEIDEAIELIEQLDGPQKPVVPQFVADWIEQRKDEGWKLSQMFLQANLEEKYGRWIVDNQETFARAWLDGYTVEKEKRYYVRLKGVDENHNYFNCIKHLDAWCLTELKTDKKFRMTHTRKQLEDADFGWVFDCPGIEIEELEE